jgi:DNA-binding NarL/FixJ family response regulator
MTNTGFYCMEVAMERPIRVLVADRLKLMREVIIATLADQPDIEVVGEVSEEGEILARVQETRPDFLFIGLDDPDRRPALCDRVLHLHPEVYIIAIGAHSNRSACYWAAYDIQSSVLESSEEAILAAVRGKGVVGGETSCKGRLN